MPERKGAAPRFVAACPFGPPVDPLDLPEAEEEDTAAASSEADGADDDEDDDDDDDDEEDEEPVATGLVDGPGRCLFVDGELTVGYQTSRVTGPTARIAGARNLSRSSMTGLSSFNITHVTRGDGPDIVARIGFDGGASELTLTTASLTYGRFTGGLSDSRFDVWAGDEFSFRALASSQSPLLASWTLIATPRFAATLSAEEPSFRRVTVSGYGGVRRPDVVGRMTFGFGDSRLTLTAAQRHQRFTDSSRTGAQGYAAQASLNLSLGEASYLILQATHARNAVGFLGVNTASNTLGVTLPGFLSASVAELSRGSSGAVVLVTALSENWTAAAFTSASLIDVPRVCSGCYVETLRSAANLTYAPNPAFSIAFEAGRARVISQVPGFPSSRTWTLTTTITRTF